MSEETVNLFPVIIAAYIICMAPTWFIAKRTGVLPGWPIFFIIVFNSLGLIIALWIFALATWPKEKNWAP